MVQVDLLHFDLADISAIGLDLNLVAKDAAAAPGIAGGLVPNDQAELPDRGVLDLEVALVVGDDGVGMVEAPHVGLHPRVDITPHEHRRQVALQLANGVFALRRDDDVAAAVGAAVPFDVVHDWGGVLDDELLTGAGDQYVRLVHAARLIHEDLLVSGLLECGVDLVLGELDTPFLDVGDEPDNGVLDALGVLVDNPLVVEQGSLA